MKMEILSGAQRARAARKAEVLVSSGVSGGFGGLMADSMMGHKGYVGLRYPGLSASGSLAWAKGLGCWDAGG